MYCTVANEAGRKVNIFRRLRDLSKHLNSLLPHAARWRQLIIHAYLDKYSRTMSADITLSPLVDLRVPALEKIIFGCPGRSIRREGFDCPPGAMYKPLLRRRSRSILCGII
jgi:hypothetical protein